MEDTILYHNFVNDEHINRSHFFEGSEIDDIKAYKPILFLPHSTFQRKIKEVESIRLEGILESGRKATVTLTGLEFSFEIFYTRSVKEDLDCKIKGDIGVIDEGLVENSKGWVEDFFKEVFDFIEATRPKNHEFILSKVFNAGIMRHEKQLGVKLYYTKGSLRNSALDLAYKSPAFYVTGNFPKVDELNTVKKGKPSAAWVELTNYKYSINSKRTSYRSDSKGDLTYDEIYSTYMTKADVSFELNIKNYNEPDKDTKLPEHNNNVNCAFDIETVGFDQSKNILSPSNVIFNITASFYNRDKRLNFNIYFTNDNQYHPELAINNAVNIVCKIESQVILAFARVLALIQPDFMIHYNGFGFDIPMILLKARVHDIFDHVYCLSSLYYYDNFDEKEIKIVNGNKIMKNKAGFTKWQNIYTTSEISGIYKVRGQNIGSHKPLLEIKLDNGSDFNAHYWAPAGSISCDMYVACTMLHPKELEGKKMNVFLQKYGLDEKYDLDYADIWKFWKENRFDKIKYIFEYCMQDSIACGKLCDAISYIPNAREFAKLTGFDMFKTIYRGNSSKVLGYYDRHISDAGFCMIENTLSSTRFGKFPHLSDHVIKEKFKYQGAHVGIYKKGKIYAEFDVTHLVDTTLSEEELQRLYYFDHERRDGKIFARILMPIEALDFASLYPSLMMAYNISPDKMTVFKDRISGKYTYYDERDHLPDWVERRAVYIADHGGDHNKLGILPKKLLELKINRSGVKKEMDAAAADMKKFTKGSEEYKDALRRFITANSKQLAIKVLMNSVYGYMGTNISPFYDVLVAHLITKKGRESLWQVNDFIKLHNHELCYNDTDSAYFHFIKDNFVRKVEQFYKTRDYNRLCKALVQKSMRLNTASRYLVEYYTKKGDETKAEYFKNNKTFYDLVNENMVKISGANFLELAREETLFPAIYNMLKKYSGVVHTRSYNASRTIKDILFKGMDITIRKKSVFAKKFNADILIKVLDSPTTDVEKFILDELDKEFETLLLKDYGGKHKLSDFQQFGRYKPGTANVIQSVVKNANKLLELNDPELNAIIKTPDVLEVVGYLTVDTNNRFNIRLCKKEENKTSRSYPTNICEHMGWKPSPLETIKTITSAAAQLLSYKEYSFYEDGMESKEYKKRIQDNLGKRFDEMYKSTNACEFHTEIQLYVSSVRKYAETMYVISTRQYPRSIRNILLIMRKEDNASIKSYVSKIINSRLKTEPDIIPMIYDNDKMLEYSNMYRKIEEELKGSHAGLMEIRECVRITVNKAAYNKELDKMVISFNPKQTLLLEKTGEYLELYRTLFNLIAGMKMK